MSRRLLWIGALAALALAGTAVVRGRWGATDAPQQPTAAARAAQRIVAIAPSTVEIICELGAGDRLVGVSTYCTYPPEVADLPRIGGSQDPDLEGIIALAPDLLITRGAGEALKRLCHEHGIRIYEDPTDSLAGMYQAIGEIGELLHRPGEAIELVQRIRNELEHIRNLVGDREPVPVLLSIRRPGTIAQIYTVGRRAYLNDLLEIAGGANVFGDVDLAWPVVGAEEVLAGAPEVIVEAMPGVEVDDALRATIIEQWRTLGPIPAVQNGRVQVITDAYALVPSPRMTMMARRLAQCLHPEADLDE